MTDTRIMRAQATLLTAMGETDIDYAPREGRLLDLYTVLMLVKGVRCSTEDVHDASAVARQREQPGHPDREPFSDLENSVALLVRDAIRSAADQFSNVVV